MKHTLYQYEYKDSLPEDVGTEVAGTKQSAIQKARAWVNRNPARVVTIVRSDGKSWSEASVKDSY